MLHMAGNLAKERRARGLKLNYPESVALISSELLELARDGHDVAELMSLGKQILTRDDVMDGVADMFKSRRLSPTAPSSSPSTTPSSNSKEHHA